MKIERVEFIHDSNNVESYEIGSRIDYAVGLCHQNLEGYKDKTIESIEISPTSEIVLILSGGHLVVFGNTPFRLYGASSQVGNN